MKDFIISDNIIQFAFDKGGCFAGLSYTWKTILVSTRLKKSPFITPDILQSILSILHKEESKEHDLSSFQRVSINDHGIVILYSDEEIHILADDEFIWEKRKFSYGSTGYSTVLLFTVEDPSRMPIVEL